MSIIVSSSFHRFFFFLVRLSASLFPQGESGLDQIRAAPPLRVRRHVRQRRRHPRPVRSRVDGFDGQLLRRRQLDVLLFRANGVGENLHAVRSGRRQWPSHQQLSRRRH